MTTAEDPEITEDTEETEPYKHVFVGHRFDYKCPEADTAQIHEICRLLVAQEIVPVAPQIYLTQFMYGRFMDHPSLAAALEMMASCDEVWIFLTEEENADLQRGRAQCPTSEVLWRMNLDAFQIAVRMRANEYDIPVKWKYLDPTD